MYSRFFSVMEKHRRVICGADPVPVFSGIGHFSSSSLGGYSKGLGDSNPFPSVSVVYIIESKSKLGRFDPQLADALGVPRSPLRKQLQAGEDVILPDGRVVHAAEVFFLFLL
jgi:hypothetical protein